MAKPYENKHRLDPGRLNHKLQFFRISSVSNGFGGFKSSKDLVLETRGSKQRISTGQHIGEANQMIVDAGATVFNQDTYFVIRNRKGFFPQKEDVVRVDGVDEYKIKGVVPLDDPLTYIRILCVKSE